MDVVEMGSVVLPVANAVFPEAALPDAAFAADLAAM